MERLRDSSCWAYTVLANPNWADSCRIENRKIEKLALTVQNLSVLNENEVERTACILLTLRSLTPWHGRHEKCPTHNYVPALWLITPLVCHFCVQKEKIEKKKKVFQHKHCTQKLALVQTWYNCASFGSFIFRKLSQKSLPICLQN